MDTLRLGKVGGSKEISPTGLFLYKNSAEVISGLFEHDKARIAIRSSIRKGLCRIFFDFTQQK
jgi:hypothetical protein